MHDLNHENWIEYLCGRVKVDAQGVDAEVPGFVHCVTCLRLRVGR